MDEFQKKAIDQLKSISAALWILIALFVIMAFNGALSK